MRVFSRRYIIGIIAALLLLPTVSLLAYTPYTAEITTQDTSAGARAYYPVLLPLNIAGAISLGMLDADGLYSSLEDGATPVKYLLTGDKVAYVIPALGAGESVLYTLTLGESSPQTSFPIIVGRGGYITTADNAALEPGDTFELIYDGYIDTSAGASKYLVSKDGALSLYVSGDEELTCNIITDPVYPVIEGYTGGYDTDDTSNHTVNLPAETEDGHLLLIFFTSDGTPSITFPAGWTELYATSNSAVKSGAWYKVASGEGASISVTTGVNEQASYVSYAISGWSDIECGSAVTGSDNKPDPPSLTASWGTLPNLWFAAAGNDAQIGVSSYPANYSGGLNYHGTKTSASGIGVAHRYVTSGTENPGSFTFNSVVTSVANTVVIKPGYPEFTVTAADIESGEHEVKLSADGTNLYLYVDDVLKDSVALDGASVIDSAANWVFMKNNVSPYIDYISYSVSGTPQFTYEPTSLISGTTLVDEVNSFDGTITWGTNNGLTLSSTGFKSTGVYEPGGGSSGTLPVVIGAPTTAPDMFIDPTAAMTNTLPYQDLVNPAATSLDWSSRTLYTILAIIVAIGLSVGVTIATGSLLLGASAAGIILLVGWNMSIISFWVVLAYAIMILTYLVTVRSM